MCYPLVSYFGSSKLKKKLREKNIMVYMLKLMQTFVKMGGVEIRISPETELTIYVRHRANYAGI